MFKLESLFRAAQVFGQLPPDFLFLPRSHNQVQIIGSHLAGAETLQPSERQEQLQSWTTEREWCDGRKSFSVADCENEEIPALCEMFPPGEKPFPRQKNAIRGA